MTIFVFVATVFGDPHIITFDNVEYTFNGKGEFILVQANKGKELLNIQGRFEQVPENIYGEVRATQLTSIVGEKKIESRQENSQTRLCSLFFSAYFEIKTEVATVPMVFWYLANEVTLQFC